MINNKEQIKNLLVFDSNDDFYHLQILKRKKENPDLGSNSYVIKTYYIRSVEHLEKRFSEITHLCDFHNARAYINLNPRSFERIAFHTLKKISDIIMNKDYPSVRNAYESAAGAFPNGKNKRWVIDVDSFDEEYIERIKINLILFQEAAKQEPITVRIPTKNGIHFITKPFDVRKITLTFPEIDVHRNNPTLLYF